MDKSSARRPTAAKSQDAADYQRVPRPVAAMPKTFADRASTGWHDHERAQLLFALGGAMAVDTEVMRWTIPQHRALWIPPRTPHRVTMRGRVDMRSLYLDPRGTGGLPRVCTALEVTPLARELIARATELPVLYDEAGIEGLVMKLLLAEVATLKPLPLGLPLPAEASLLRPVLAWLGEPSAPIDARSCAAALGVSERTFMRRFAHDTGLTFGQWRQRARLLEAIDRLTAGVPVTRVAVELGYDSPSAFAAMFRRTLGMAPSRLRAGPQG